MEAFKFVQFVFVHLFLQDNDGVYQPPKFAPTTMEDDDKTSRKERNAIRMGKLALKRASQSDYVRGLIDEIEDRPEEVS